jgi:galactosamine-6-phosphate isomerase
MQLQIFDSPDQLAVFASDLIIDAVQQKNDLLLCTATGNSTTKTYKELVNKKDLYSCEHVRIIKLDEWGGIPMESPATCESYLHLNLLNPLKIIPRHYFGFESHAEDPEKECIRMQHILQHEGPIDLCILGIGLNGHIAFNEPSPVLEPFCHTARLSPSSLNHKMIKDIKDQPTYGLTLGLADILLSRKILLLISGQSKAEITRDLMKKKITTSLPASLLWLHPEVYCLCDKEAYSLSD